MKKHIEKAKKAASRITKRKSTTKKTAVKSSAAKAAKHASEAPKKHVEHSKKPAEKTKRKIIAKKSTPKRTPRRTTKKASGSSVGVYTNLAHKRRTKKDSAARRRAEYLASLPKHPIKRFFVRLHPKHVFAFWFSRHGFLFGLKLTGIAILLGVLTVGGIFAYYRKDLESINPAKLAERVQTTVTRYYDRNNNLLWEDKGTDTYRLAVKSNEISKYAKQATIAIEDKDFYSHEGISISGIARSLVNNSRGGSIQGGSTLTQQLVKQVFLADEADKRGLDGIPRKIKEAILAIEVERKYTKEEILTLYLNESPYGGRRNGIESAARSYFGKSAQELNLAESALLAAIPNQPGLYDPYNKKGHDVLIKRQHKTLNNMVELGYVSQKEADEAKKIPILDSIKPLSNQLENIKAPHFVMMVRSQLERELGKAIVGRGGLTVKTSLDIRIQDRLEKSMKRMFDSNTPRYLGFNNGAATVSDVKTGQVLALMGSRDFNYPGFGSHNAATSFIPPGSTMKPLVYAQLFTNQGPGKPNYGAGSILADDKSADRIYGAPLKNLDNRYKGAISLRSSLSLSRNIPAVKAMYLAGQQKTWNTIRELGDKDYCTQGVEVQAGLSSALGSCGTKQIDHVNAFASLARGGVYKPVATVLEVRNSQNEILKSFKDESKSVIDPQAAYLVSDILSDNRARLGLVGNSVGFNIPGIQTAIKTGTSDRDGDAKDLWTLSYSSAIAVGTWFGNADSSVLNDGNSAIGGRIIGDIIPYVHNEIYIPEGKWKRGEWIPRPSGIKTLRGDIYPSYYNSRDLNSTEKLVFDKYSKKKATQCTPELAKVSVEVVSYIDPISKRKVYRSGEYNPNEDDDVHSCSDTKPSITVSSSSDGSEITVNYTKGTHALQNVTVSVNGRQVANLTVSGSGTRVISNTADTSKSLTISGKVIDSKGYQSAASTSWTAPASSPSPAPTTPESE